MNFLAHAYLSFRQPDLMTGNMIGDFVKGRQLALYPQPIQEGIRLHRAIDTFTDNHPATFAARAIFRPQTRLYGAVFTDIVMDHFLANDPRHFTDTSLQAFAQEVYSTVGTPPVTLPTSFTHMLGYMSSQNWLYNYRFRNGMEQTFRGIVRRAKYITFEASVPLSVFDTHYNALQQCYDEFFPDLYAFVQEYTAA